MYYKLSDYAKKFGVTYRTAWNRFNVGKIEGAYVDNTGHVCIPIISVEKLMNKKAALYARVSSNGMKDNLDRQMERVMDFAIKNGYEIINSQKEIAFGLNDTRTKLTKILNQVDEWDVLIVENKDRLTRFGFNLIEKLLEMQGKKILVINHTEDNNEKKDLINDLVSIIYSFSARIYGLRRAKNMKNENLKTTETDNNANLLLTTGFSWQSRYSRNEKSDKHGRWARLFFYRGLLICWISRIEHVDLGTFYTVRDFFPTTGNDMPEYVGKETDFEKAKEGAERRFNEFLKTCCYTQVDCEQPTHAKAMSGLPRITHRPMPHV